MRTLIIRSAVAIGLVLGVIHSIQAGELELLQKIRDAQVDEINRKYVDALRKLKAGYLKAGDREKADEVDAEIQKYSRRTYFSAEQMAEVKVTGEFRDFKAGEIMFPNRDYKWENIPRRYSKWEALFRLAGGRQRLAFEVDSPGLVYLVVESGDLKRFPEDEWETAETFKVNISKGKNLSILEKELDAGQYTFESTGFVSVRLIRPKAESD